MASNSLINFTCSALLRPYYRKVICTPGSTQSSLIDVKVIESCGSFSYLPTAFTRNRFIVWRTSGQDLFLEEHALGVDLRNNCICVQFQNSVVLPGTRIFETLDHTIILVFTVSSVHRIVLPHPCAFDSQKSNQSILSEITSGTLSDPKNCCTISLGSTNVSILPNASACSLSASEEALFAYGRTDGSVLLITLPSLDENGPPSQDILHYSSALRRLFSGLVTPFGAASEPNLSDKIASLTFYAASDDVRLFVFYGDFKLRCWSCKRKDVDVDVDLSLFFDDAPKLNSSLSAFNCEKWKVRCLNSEHLFYLALFVYFNDDPKFLILSCEKSGAPGEPVNKVFLIDGICEMELIDYQLLRDKLITICRSDDITCWKYIPLDLENCSRGRWISKNIDFLEPVDGFAGAENALDRFVDYVFRPAMFTIETIVKSIKICCNDFVFDTSITKCAPGADVNPYFLKDALRKYLQRVELKADSVRRTVHKKVIPTVTADALMTNLLSCLLQYHKASSTVQGLFTVSVRNLYGIITQDRLALAAVLDKSVGCSTHSTCSRYDICNFDLHFETRFTKCLHLIRNWFSSDDCLKAKEFMNLVWRDRISPNDVIKEQMSAVFVNEESMRDFRPLLSKCEKTFLSGVDRAVRAMQPNLNLFPELCQVTTSGSQQNHADMFSKEKTRTLVPAMLRKCVLARLNLCRDLLMFLHAFLRINPEIGLPEELMTQISQAIIPELTELCRFYVVLHWLLNLPFKHLQNGDSNLPLIATLDISSTDKPAGPKELQTITTVRFLFDDFFGSEFAYLLNKGLNICVNDLSNFTAVSGFILDTCFSYLWPAGHSLDLFDFLMQNNEFCHAVELCDALSLWCVENIFVRHYIKGEGLLRLGKTDEAIRQFRLAYKGVTCKDVALLNRAGLTDLPDDQHSVQYYLRVADLFEQRGFNEQVIELCTECLRETATKQKQAHLLWTLIFKHYLALNRFDEAFVSMQYNKDFSSKRTCLRLFVVRLLELKRLQKLISYEYASFEQDFIDILEHRARNSDIQQENVYSILGAYCMKKQNYRKAAYYFYELSLRLKYEPVNQESLSQRLRALTVCVQNLSLVREDYRWIVRPAIFDRRFANSGVSPKRNLDDEELTKVRVAPQSAQLELIAHIKSELLLAQANLAIAKKSKLYTYLSPPEAVLQLCCVRHFDEAACLSVSFDLPLDTVLESLTLACMKLASSNPSHAKDSQKLEDEFEWLERNRMFMKFSCFELKASDIGWKILESFLQHFSHIQQPSLLYKCVCRKILSYNNSLPAWFTVQFKKVDFPEFLRILIEFDRFDEAADEICQYIQSLLSGVGLEDFSLKNGLSAAESPVIFPYSSVDALLELFDGAILKDCTKQEKKTELQRCLKTYLNHLTKTRHSTRQSRP